MSQREPSFSTSVNSGIYRQLAWIGVVLQVIGLVVVFWFERWGGSWTMAAFLLLSVVLLLMRDNLPSLLELFVVLAALINAFGWSLDLFDKIIWYDELVHFFTSLSVMAAIGFLAWNRGLFEGPPPLLRFIAKIALVGFGLGLLWEAIEMVFLNLHPVDTVTDLILDVLGACVGAVLVSRFGFRKA